MQSFKIEKIVDIFGKMIFVFAEIVSSKDKCIARLHVIHLHIKFTEQIIAQEGRFHKAHMLLEPV